MRPLTTIFSTIAGLLVFSLAALLLAPLAAQNGVGAMSPDGSAGHRNGAKINTLTIKPDEAKNGGSEREASASMSAADEEAGDLERMAPREPLSGLGRAQPPQRPEIFRLFRPVAPAAGRIEAGGYEIVVAGVKPVDPGVDCEAADGSTWPCGMRARTAFRLWLRGRAIDCKLPDESTAKKAVTASCSLDGTDAGRWLVENGWTPAVSDGSFAGLEKQARKARRGIFGNGPKSLRQALEN